MNSQRVATALRTEIEDRHDGEEGIVPVPAERGAGSLSQRRELRKLRTRLQWHLSLKTFASVWRTLTLLICAQLRRESEAVKIWLAGDSVRRCRA